MKGAFLLVFEGLADWEPAIVCYDLRVEHGIPVTTIGFSREPVRTGGGLRILPDLAIDDVDPEDADLLILPGGEMWPTFHDERLEGLVWSFRRSGKIVAAICAATTFLARIGIFREGIRHTSDGLDFLQQVVPEYRDEAYYVDAYAVRDQGVITANGFGSVEFAFEIAKELKLYDEPRLREFAKVWNCRNSI